ncbi:MAG TPA: zf-HC2 domain-containing protein, partial [Candidatus Limnocylindrales bacterium]
MSLRRRVRRPDDWATSHARAQAALSDRLDGDLELSESDWLDQHLAGCADCRATAAAYDAQRAELRAMRDRQPEPPRDLWARTAAAIEHESRFRDGRVPAGDRRRRSALVPVFAAALVVAVVVGTLTSSRLLFGGGPTAQPTEGPVAVATAGSSALAAATPIPVGQHVQWISQAQDGSYTLRQADVRSVCPEGSDPCEASAPVEDQPVTLTDRPQTVFGSRDGQQLIVVNRAGVSQDASVAVVTIEPEPEASPSPGESTTPSPTPTPRASTTPSARPTQSAAPTRTPVATATTQPSAPAAPSNPVGASPTPTPSASPVASSASPTPGVPGSASPSPEASPTVTVTPSASPDGAVQIAEDVILVGQSAAYSPNGEWFAFTARPADGSAGPDIFVWKVGEPAAHALTTDHRSTFGSWVGDDIAVGSSVAEATGGPGPRAGASFLLDPRTAAQVALPQTGRTWRPSVDPTGRRAVYWAGSLRRSDDAPVDVPDDGRLV